MQVSIMQGGKDKFKSIPISGIQELASIMKSHTYSLGSFLDDYRTNNNFKASQFVGLDFDNGLSLTEAVQIFKNHTHIIGTTRNHQKDKNGIIADRFRVILKLDKEITNQKDYKTTVQNLLELFPSADSQCSDAARMFYPCSEIISTNLNGKATKSLVYVPPGATEIKPVVAIGKGRLSRNTMDFITTGPESSSQKGTVSNTRLFKAAVDCLEQGYTEAEAIEVLKPSVKNYGGEFNDNDLKTIASAYNRDPKHAPRLKESCFSFKKATELSADTKDTAWIVDGLLIEGGLSIMAGMPKSGKSTLTRQLALAVSKGGSFLDRPVRKGKVIYLALEEQENLLVDQFKHIGVKDTDDIMLHVGPLNTGNVIDSLREAIESYGATLVVIDTLLLLLNFDNPNDYNEAYKKLSHLRNVARQTSCHMIALHHQNKGEDRGANSVLGSSGLQGAVDNTLILNSIRNRESYRKISSFQRGGVRFINKELKYNTEMDIYEVANQESVDF